MVFRRLPFFQHAGFRFWANQGIFKRGFQASSADLAFQSILARNKSFFLKQWGSIPFFPDFPSDSAFFYSHILPSMQNFLHF
jgi:hypothetical protein